MARRKTEVFSMSFLDCITCAFGSVVLVYVLINARGGLRQEAETNFIRAEFEQVEQQLLQDYQNLVVLKNSMAQTDSERARTEGLAPRLLQQLQQSTEELADADKQTLSRREAIERLKADLKSLEEGTRRLEGGSKSKETSGTRVRGFTGEGDRQYLTGLKVGGKHILILMDVSASMLDETVVNVLRMRNMSQTRQLLAEKWVRAISIADWVSAQLPLESEFQMYTFNTQAQPLITGSEGRWLKVNDPDSLNDALANLRKVVPAGGTSLENALAVINGLTPRPDSVILITDSLPTQGTKPPLFRKTVDGDQRLELFGDAIKRLPRGVPLNVVLLPLEGDPSAPTAYWLAARRSGGSFLMPSKDWP